MEEWDVLEVKWQQAVPCQTLWQLNEKKRELITGFGEMNIFSDPVKNSFNTGVGRNFDSSDFNRWTHFKEAVVLSADKSFKDFWCEVGREMRQGWWVCDLSGINRGVLVLRWKLCQHWGAILWTLSVERESGYFLFLMTDHSQLPRLGQATFGANQYPHFPLQCCSAGWPRELGQKWPSISIGWICNNGYLYWWLYLWFKKNSLYYPFNWLMGTKQGTASSIWV